MSDSKTSAAGGGIGFGGMLTILFIALKLLGKIDWPWHWVLSPIWLPIAVVLALCVVVGGGAWIVSKIIDRVDRRRIARQRTSRALPVGRSPELQSQIDTAMRDLNRRGHWR